MVYAPPALLVALLLAGLAGANPVFAPRSGLPRLPEHRVLPWWQAPDVCWGAETRVLVPESSLFSGQASGACARLEEDVCIEKDRTWYPVTFDNGYANTFRFSDLLPCENDSAAAPDTGSYLVSQSAVIATRAIESDVEAAVWLVLQDALYETTLRSRRELDAATLDDSLMYCNGTKQCNITVSASGTNESSPFGDDTVVPTNQQSMNGLDPTRPPELDVLGTAKMWAENVNIPKLWRVDYRVVVPGLRAALSVATLMQDLALMHGLFHSGFEMALTGRGWTDWYRAVLTNNAAEMRGAAIGSIVLSRPSLQHISAASTRAEARSVDDWNAERSTTGGEEDAGQQAQQTRASTSSEPGTLASTEGGATTSTEANTGTINGSDEERLSYYRPHLLKPGRGSRGGGPLGFVGDRQENHGISPWAATADALRHSQNKTAATSTESDAGNVHRWDPERPDAVPPGPPVDEAARSRRTNRTQSSTTLSRPPEVTYLSLGRAALSGFFADSARNAMIAVAAVAAAVVTLAALLAACGVAAVLERRSVGWEAAPRAPEIGVNVQEGVVNVDVDVEEGAGYLLFEHSDVEMPHPVARPAARPARFPHLLGNSAATGRKPMERQSQQSYYRAANQGQLE